MEELTCCACGQVWTRRVKRGSKPHRCPDCAAKKRLRRKTRKHKARGFAPGAEIPERECIVCSAPFQPNTQGQRTCPPSEEDRAGKKHPSKAQSWCARRLYRFELGELETLEGQPSRAFECVTCRERCVPGQDGVHINAKKFCSRRKCKSKYFSQLYRSGIDLAQLSILVTSGPSCLVSAKPKTRRFISNRCLECGQPFVGKRKGTAKYCRKRCKRAKAQRRRRALLKEAFVEDVHKAEVAKRCGYQCHICRGHVDMSLPPQDDLAAELEHVIPLTFGGLHNYDNAGLAHRQCNCAKGALEGSAVRLGLSKVLAQDELCDLVNLGLSQWLENPDSLPEIIRGWGVIQA